MRRTSPASRDTDRHGYLAPHCPGRRQLLARYPALQHVQVVSDLTTVPSDATLLLGFHGLARDTIEDLTGRGIKVKNYKCPFIAKLDATVERLVAEGFDILILGKRQNHHCQYAQEVASTHQRQCRVFETLEDVDTIPGTREHSGHSLAR